MSGKEYCGVTGNAPRRARRTIRCGAAMLLFSLAGLLSGCTAALTPPEPAAPTNPPAAQASPSESDTLVGSNPYDAGAERAWNVELASAPSFVGYDEKSNTLIVGEDGIGTLRDASISAYSVTTKGDILPEWTSDIQGAKSVTAMELGEDSVYLNIVARDGRSDFLVLSRDKGEVLSQWSRTNPLDSDVPQIVTAVDGGVGVLKSGSTRTRAAILNSAGEVLDSEDIFFDTEDDAVDDAQSNGESVGVVDPFAVQGLPSFVQRVIYPSLIVLPGSLCYGAVDGFVCVDDSPNAEQIETARGMNENGKGETDKSSVSSTKDSESASSDNAQDNAQETQIVVTEYDLSGHSMRVNLAGEETAAAQLALVSVNADAAAREIADALLADYDSSANGTSSTSDGSKSSDSKAKSSASDKHKSGDSGNAGELGGEDVLSDAVADSQLKSGSTYADIRERHPAMLYDGEWIVQEQWEAPAGFDGSEQSIKHALKAQVPLYQISSGAIINARSGRQLTADGAIGYAGVGQSASMLFEYDHGVLYYLEPLGDVNSAGDSAVGGTEK